MKNKIYISLFAALAFGLGSCHSDIDNFMVDDTVGFMNPGLVEVEVYSGTDDPTNVYAIKAGKGFQSAQVSVTVDPTVIDEYNALTTTYNKVAALPEDCYTVSVSSLELTQDDYRKPFVINWNRENLEAALAQNEYQVVPLRMTVVTDGNIAEDRLVTLVKPSVEVPLVGFDRSGLITGVMPTRETPVEEEIYFKVKSNFIAQRDVNYVLELDETLIAKYNEANGTDYVMLPEEAFELDLEGGMIKKHLDSDMFMLKFHRKALVPEGVGSKFGNYMLPIRLKSVSSTNIDEAHSVILYNISVVAAEINKSSWEILDCNSDINDDETAAELDKLMYGPYAFIDGNSEVDWRPVGNVTTELPYYVVIDMKKAHELYKMRLQLPATTTATRYINSKAGKVYASNDGEEWTEILNWQMEGKNIYDATFALVPGSWRYVKFEITELFGQFSDRKIKNKNYTTIGEITFLGE